MPHSNALITKDMATNKNSNTHQGHRERMRQRVQTQGIENMPQHEVLEFLLYPFIPMKDTNPIAHELIDRFGSLQKVFDASPISLSSVKNMTDVAALYLSSLPKLFKLYNIQKFGDSIELHSPSNTANYFSALFAGNDKESIYIVILDAKYQLVDTINVGDGDLNSCKMRIKDFILNTACTSNKNVIIAHNHPSGDARPSQQDNAFTDWILSLTELVGVNLLDHIIVTKKQYYSYAINKKFIKTATAYSDDGKNVKVHDVLGHIISDLK